MNTARMSSWFKNLPASLWKVRGSPRKMRAWLAQTEGEPVWRRRLTWTAAALALILIVVGLVPGPAASVRHGILLGLSLVLVFYLLFIDRRSWWPELGLAFAVLMVFTWVAEMVSPTFRPPAFLLPPRPAPAVQLPVQATRFIGSPVLMTRGKWIDLVAVVPDANKKPVPYQVSGLQVVGLLGKNGPVSAGNYSDVDTVLLGAPPASAPTVQAALLNPDTRFLYQVLPAEPTPTATPSAITTTVPSPTPAPSPTVTPPPPAGEVYVTLSLAGLQPQPAALVPGPARLVIVGPAPARATEQPTTPAGAVPSLPSFEGCPTIVAFAGADGSQQAHYSERQSEEVLLRLPVADLARYAAGLAAAQSVWLVNDSTCK